MGDAENARDMGMGMPITRGCPKRCDTGVNIRLYDTTQPVPPGVLGVSDKASHYLVDFSSIVLATSH